MSKRKPDPSKVLKPSQAAARLNIAHKDLPKLDRPWTRGDVLRLRKERPDWLTAARKEYGAKREAAADARRAHLEKLNKLLDDAGYPDVEQPPYTDDVEAYYYLIKQHGVSEKDAREAVDLRWPDDGTPEGDEYDYF